MCQAIRDGGRRCPSHRRETQGIIQHFETRTNGILDREQMITLFSDLRREGRGSLSTGQDYWESYLDSAQMLGYLDADTAQESLSDGDVPDGATLYALRRFSQRLVESNAKLSNKLRSIAVHKGWGFHETVDKFRDLRAQVPTRGAAPAEFNRSNLNATRRAGLPADRATVVALAKLEATPVKVDESRRVQTEVLGTNPKSMIRAGYDDGRLEVQVDSTTIMAYRNVPQHVWDEMRESENPSSYFITTVYPNASYAYATLEEAEADAYRVNCSGCGQFVARDGSHECPARVEEEDPASVDSGSVATSAEAESESSSEQASEGEGASENGINQEAVNAQLNPPACEQPEPLAIYYRSPRLSEDGTRTITYRFSFGSYQPSNLYTLERISSRYPELYEANREELEDIASGNYHNAIVIITQSLRLGDEGANLSLDMQIIRSCNAYRSVLHDGVWGEAYYDLPRYGTSLRPGEVDFTTNNELRAADSARMEKRREAGLQVAVASSATATRVYKVDGNIDEPAKIAWAKVREFRSAINDGKEVSAPLSWEFPARRRNQPDRPLVDDQGYAFPAQSRGRAVKVEGEMVLRRNADGTFEMVNSGRSLRCNCSDYRRTYHCSHVDYVMRHAGNLGQQMYTPEARPSTTRSRQPAATISTSLGEIPASLFINGVSVQSRYDSEGNESGGYINMTSACNRSRTIAFAAPSISDLPSKGASIEEVVNWTGRTMATGAALDAPAPRTLQRALRYGPVNLQRVYLYLHSGSQVGYVSATDVEIARNEDGTLSFTTRELRCSCQRYRETYRCEHVRAVEDHNLLRRAMFPEDEEDGRTVTSQEGEDLRYRARMLANTLAFSHPEVATASDLYQAYAYNCSPDQAANLRRQYVEEAEERRREERLRADEAIREQVRQRELEAQRKNKAFLTGAAKQRATTDANWKNREPGYTENPQEFIADYEEGLRRQAAGSKEPLIPFRTENVLDGMSDNYEGSRTFGVEIEFDIAPDKNKSDALRAIAADLHAAGLTQYASQQGYHAATSQPAGAYTKWSFENDCTVAGELVSPMMKDTPEHWEQLRKAVEIIKKHGGVASTRAGSHVHVSNGSYDTSTAKRAELMRTVIANEDVLYRMASNPFRGRHRGTSWCAPNVLSSELDEDISKDVQTAHNLYYYAWGSRESALNMSNASLKDASKANVEFRVWDASLDPGVIQTQIAMSVAMVDHAERVIEEKGISTRREKTLSKGTNFRLFGNKKEAPKDVESLKAEHGPAMELIDSLFRRKEDRKAATMLYAATNWNE